MERVVEICERRGITLVEDCAHTCGVMWRGRQLGYHGKVEYNIRPNTQYESNPNIYFYLVYYCGELKSTALLSTVFYNLMIESALLTVPCLVYLRGSWWVGCCLLHPIRQSH